MDDAFARAAETAWDDWKVRQPSWPFGVQVVAFGGVPDGEAWLIKPAKVIAHTKDWGWIKVKPPEIVARFVNIGEVE